MDRDDLRNRFRTDYTKPSLAEQPASISVAQHSNLESTINRRKKITIVAVVAFILLTGLATSGWLLMQTEDPTPPSVKASVSLPLYYPEKLPPGFALNEKSYSVNGEVVSFNASKSNGDKILFTVQPRPPTFDYQTFYQKGLSGTEQFTTPIGQAAIGKAQNKLIGNLVTDVSWVLIGTNSSDISASDLRLVLNGLKRSN